MTRIRVCGHLILFASALAASPHFAFGIDRTILGEKTTACVYSHAGARRELSGTDNQKRSLVVFWSRQNRFSELELKNLCGLQV